MSWVGQRGMAGEEIDTRVLSPLLAVGASIARSFAALYEVVIRVGRSLVDRWICGIN